MIPSKSSCVHYSVSTWWWSRSLPQAEVHLLFPLPILALRYPISGSLSGLEVFLNVPFGSVLFTIHCSATQISITKEWRPTIYIVISKIGILYLLHTTNNTKRKKIVWNSFFACWKYPKFKDDNKDSDPPSILSSLKLAYYIYYTQQIIPNEKKSYETPFLLVESIRNLKMGNIEQYNKLVYILELTCDPTGKKC